MIRAALRRAMASAILFGFGMTGAIAQAQATPFSHSRIRFVHAAEEIGTVDVYLGGALAFEQRGFKSVSDYASIPAGILRVQAIAATSKATVMNIAISLAPQTDYTLVLPPSQAGQQPQSALLQDDNQLPGQSAIRFRLANLSPDVGSVQTMAVISGTEHNLSPMLFRSSSSYAELPPGEALIHLSDIKRATVKLEPDTVYTFFLFEEHGHATIGISVDAQGVRYLLPTTGGELSELAGPRAPQ